MRVSARPNVWTSARPVLRSGAVGLISKFRFARHVAMTAPEPHVQFGAGEPSVTVSDVLSLLEAGATTSVSRQVALSVSSVLRGRNLVCNIATLPLITLDPARNRVREPLLEQIDPDVPNVVTLAATLEDLLMDGYSWWLVISRGWNEYPTQARHVDPNRITLQPPNTWITNRLPAGIDPASVVWLDGAPVSKRDVIRFDSPNPGILRAAHRTINRAVRFEATAEMYAGDPRPLDYFTRNDGAQADPSPTRIKKAIADWIEARRKRATAYVPDFLEYNTVDAPSPADLQLVELQRQVTLDLANVLGIDPEDLGLSTTSRTYQNATDRRQDRINDMLASYMRAMTDRLTMNDVTRRGYRVIFDLSEYMRADPETRWGVYDTAVRMGAMTLDEVAMMENLPDRPRTAPRPPAPPAVPADDDETTQEATPVDNSQPLRLALSSLEGTQSFTFDVDPATFRADSGKRTIAGLLIPYGAVGTNGQGRWRFAPGSVEWAKAAVSRVKLNDAHDRRALLGAATMITATDAGVTAQFKIRRGDEGDKALMAAEDGVTDGLSAELDIIDYGPDPQDEGGYLVLKSRLYGAALTGNPAFDDARLTSVSASRHTERTTDVPDIDAPTAPVAPAPTAPVAPAPPPDFAAMITAALSRYDLPLKPQTDDKPAVVDPAKGPTLFVAEPPPYRFDRAGNFVASEHEFSRDLLEMSRTGDLTGTTTDAGKRVMALLRANFTIEVADVNELNPNIQQPDMFVDQRDYVTPLWDAVNKGAPPNGVQPFTFPKFSSASGLVGDHTAGTEPTSGNYVTTDQTVTPTAISGKASLQREVFDMGGNPAVSGLIYNQMRRGYFEGLEAATATFLNTLTAATDINLGVAATDAAFVAAWEGALADLQFIRSYDFSVFVLEKEAYKKFAGAKSTTGEPIFPVINPTNRNGTSAARFRTLDLSGVTGLPSWALPSTAGSPNNSWLFDRLTMWGWATPPTRLEFTTGTAAAGGYAPVAMVDIAIWGYKAFANSDIAGVRQVIYDTV